MPRRRRRSADTELTIKLIAWLITALIAVAGAILYAAVKATGWLWQQGKYGRVVAVIWAPLVVAFFVLLARPQSSPRLAYRPPAQATPTVRYAENDRSRPTATWPADLAPLLVQDRQGSGDDAPRSTPTATDEPTATEAPTLTAIPSSVAPPPPTPTDVPTPIPSLILQPTPTWTPHPTATLPAPAAATPEPALATVRTGANLRAGPGTDFAVVGAAAAGQAVAIQAANPAGDWYQLSSGEWVFAELVSVAEPAAAAPQRTVANISATSSQALAVVNVDILNVRFAPDAAAPVLDKLARSSCVEVIGSVPQWSQVRQESVGTGWCWSEYLTPVTVCPTPAPYVPPARYQEVAAYAGTPLRPNTTAIGNATIYECFGSGTTQLRELPAGTPIEVLGAGAFQPPGEMAEAMGQPPFLKIRLWEGQVAWLTSSDVVMDLTTLPQLSGQCEAYDQLNWSQVIAERPPTPTPFQTWTAPQNSGGSGGCCKICTTGKACGDSCISRRYTCHKGPGCACNG